jgi:small subunit ribosomal protein S10
MQKIEIKLKSFDFNSIENFKTKIQQIFNILEIKNPKFITFPISRKRYTLERSPHIDKKSREQFEQKHYKSQIILNSKNLKKISIFIYILRNSLFPGVQIEMSLQFSDFLLQI